MKERVTGSGYVASLPDVKDARHKASILLVDDREENLVALEAVLKDLGQNLVRAKSGQEALRLLFRQDFAVILLDVRMPDMDGFEAAELIRKRQKSRDTPIIFITAADANPDQIARGYSVGAVDYIFKPFMPEVLKAKVCTFLDLFKRTEELRASEVRFRTMVTNLPGAMYRREALPPFHKLFVTDPIDRLSGYPASHFMQRRRAYTTIMDPDDVRAFSETLEEAVRKRSPYAMEYRVLHRNGRIRWILDRGQAVAGDSGMPQFMDGVLLDITGRKVAEEALSELPGHLLQTQHEERRRISMELHDRTSPLLTALTGKLYNLRQQKSGLDAATSNILEEMLSLAEDASNVIRNVASHMHPQLGDETGLLTTLRWYLSGFSSRTGIPMEIKFPDELTRLSRDAELLLFRIVQESLSNILRHSGSALVRVRITVQGRSLILDVSDEGQALPPGVLDRFKEGSVVLGMGIAGMRESARQLGVNLKINSTGSGTTVTAVMPLG
jgi:PAS domain S-box-containing protein